MRIENRRRFSASISVMHALPENVFTKLFTPSQAVVPREIIRVARVFSSVNTASIATWKNL
jgi:hypothetical protein